MKSSLPGGGVGCLLVKHWIPNAVFCLLVQLWGCVVLLWVSSMPCPSHCVSPFTHALINFTQTLDLILIAFIYGSLLFFHWLLLFYYLVFLGSLFTAGISSLTCYLQGDPVCQTGSLQWRKCENATISILHTYRRTVSVCVRAAQHKHKCYIRYISGEIVYRSASATYSRLFDRGLLSTGNVAGFVPKVPALSRPHLLPSQGPSQLTLGPNRV